MSRLVAIMSMSLDGFVADANDGVGEVFDWYMNSGDVDRELVEEARVEQLLDRVRAVDSHGSSARGGPGLLHRALETVGDEVDRRIGPRPSVRNLMRQHERRSPSMIAVPAVRDLERASTGEHRSKLGPESTKVLGAWRGHLEGHRVRPSAAEFDVPRVEVPVEHFGHAVAPVGNVSVERHGHDRDNFRHSDVPFDPAPVH